MHNTNVITIEKNIPMPEKRNYSRNRYTFLKNMEMHQADLTHLDGRQRLQLILIEKK